MAEARISFIDLYDNFWAVVFARFFFRRAELRGKKIRLWGKPAVKIYGKLVIQNRTRFDSKITPIQLTVLRDAIMEIGENTYINYGVSIASAQSVMIGKNCLIGTYVNITDNNFHRNEPARRYEMPKSEPVTIQDNVWLGTRVIVLPGVTIGEGSIIGAGSVVTHDIPERVIAAGVPAKIIRNL